jgi:hypothetical protein
VLKIASKELNARQPLDAPRIDTPGFPAECHMGLIHVENPRVADCRPKDIA